MFPGLQTGDFLALVLGGQFKLTHGGVAPLGQGREGRNGPPVYGGLGLLEDPGVAEDTPGNHNPVCPGVAEDTRGILAGEDVSVGDDGDGQGLFHSPNPVPVGGAGIHLHLGPPVEGDGGDPQVLQALGQFQADDVSLVPAQAHFHGDGDLAGSFPNGLRHPAGFVQVPEQAGAVPVVGDLGDGAAHVDVDDIWVGHLPHNGGALLHTGQVAAKDLHACWMLVFPQPHQGQGLLVLVAQGLGAHHLRYGIARPQLPADGPKG